MNGCATRGKVVPQSTGASAPAADVVVQETARRLSINPGLVIPFHVMQLLCTRDANDVSHESVACCLREDERRRGKRKKSGRHSFLVLSSSKRRLTQGQRERRRNPSESTSDLRPCCGAGLRLILHSSNPSLVVCCIVSVQERLLRQSSQRKRG